MKIPISIYINNEFENFQDAGYIEMDEFDANECFHLCNWSHWTNTKPAELHSDISSAEHGICFTNPETKEMWLAKSSGWLVGTRPYLLKLFCVKNKDRHVWL